MELPQSSTRVRGCNTLTVQCWAYPGTPGWKSAVKSHVITFHLLAAECVQRTVYSVLRTCYGHSIADVCSLKCSKIPRMILRTLFCTSNCVCVADWLVYFFCFCQLNRGRKLKTKNLKQVSVFPVFLLITTCKSQAKRAFIGVMHSSVLLWHIPARG